MSALRISTMNTTLMIIDRVCNPRKGDCFTKGNNRVTVKSVSKSTVRWIHETYDGHKKVFRSSVEEYLKLAPQTVKNGALFEGSR